MDISTMTADDAIDALDGYKAAKAGKRYDISKPNAWRDGWRLYTMLNEISEPCIIINLATRRR